ncbi:hypothetical protein [Streptomyces sp. NPDC016845]
MRGPERLHFFAAPVPFAMTRDGRITDGNTILLLQSAALNGLLTPQPPG